jgi:outer membrane protein assembly factor BamE (lipoprotein component of BamABCDE complex)
MKIKTALALFLLLGLFACSKVNLENYNKISVGMTYEEVVGLLGKPAKCDEALKLRSCTWGDAKHWVKVNFVGDNVILYSSSNLK